VFTGLSSIDQYHSFVDPDFELANRQLVVGAITSLSVSAYSVEEYSTVIGLVSGELQVAFGGTLILIF
jgi:hypothetical protein